MKVYLLGAYDYDCRRVVGIFKDHNAALTESKRLQKLQYNLRKTFESWRQRAVEYFPHMNEYHAEDKYDEDIEPGPLHPECWIYYVKEFEVIS